MKSSVALILPGDTSALTTNMKWGFVLIHSTKSSLNNFKVTPASEWLAVIKTLPPCGTIVV